MVPDESPHGTPSTPASARPTAPEQSSRGRAGLTVLAGTLAAVGFLALVAILLTAFLQREVWPGFVLATYVCLPVAFLLMIALVVMSFISRRRS